MRPTECAREQDLIDAVCAGRWPARCDDDLQTHVAACPICADVAEVAAPLLAERDGLWSDVRVPSSGTVWWRAQLRARREAARVAARPLRVAQAAGAIALLVLTAALLVLAAPAAGAWVARAVELLSMDVPRVSLPDVPRSGVIWWAVVLAVCAWLVLAPVAIYVALDEERE